MKPQTHPQSLTWLALLLVSLVVNAGLTGRLLTRGAASGDGRTPVHGERAHGFKAGEQTGKEQDPLQPSDRATSRRAALGNSGAAPIGDAPPVEIAVTNAFSWEMVRSTNFGTYATNLQAIGCPPGVVTDIIVSEVNQAFARDRHALYARVHREFWDLITTSEKGAFEHLDPEVRELNDKRKSLLEEVLGSKWEAPYEEADRRGRAEPLAFLPEDKRQQVVSLGEEFARRRAEAARGTSQDPTLRQRRMEALDREQVEARRRLLSAEEEKEYAVRQQRGAQWAQAQPGFTATEEEFHALAELRTQIPEKDTNQFNLQAKALLGEDRFAALERGQENRFREIHNALADRGWPEEAAVSAYELRRQAEQVAAQLQARTDLSPTERDAALANLRVHTRQAATESLGAEACQQLQRRGWTWLAEPN